MTLDQLGCMAMERCRCCPDPFARWRVGSKIGHVDLTKLERDDHDGDQAVGDRALRTGAQVAPRFLVA